MPRKRTHTREREQVNSTLACSRGAVLEAVAQPRPHQQRIRHRLGHLARADARADSGAARAAERGARHAAAVELERAHAPPRRARTRPRARARARGRPCARGRGRARRARASGTAPSPRRACRANPPRAGARAVDGGRRVLGEHVARARAVVLKRAQVDLDRLKRAVHADEEPAIEHGAACGGGGGGGARGGDGDRGGLTRSGSGWCDWWCAAA